MEKDLTTFRLDSMDKKLDQYIEESREFHKWMNDRFDNLEKKYAWKWTENFIIWTLSAIGIIIIWAVMSLIIIK